MSGFLVIFLLVYIGFQINAKVSYAELKKDAEKLTAEVVEIRHEKNPSARSDGTKLPYAYVRIEGSADSVDLVRLKFSNSFHRFKIGQIVPVFWNGTVLMYSDAYGFGFNALLPDRWKFWEKK